MKKSVKVEKCKSVKVEKCKSRKVEKCKSRKVENSTKTLKVTTQVHEKLQMRALLSRQTIYELTNNILEKALS